MIIDVTVPMKSDTRSLSKAASDKVSKYWSFRRALRRAFPEVKKITIRGFPVGAKGKWRRGNEETLHDMGIHAKARIREIARCCVKLALWGSINLCKRFLSKTV